jgi:plasmid stability protein
MAPKWRHGVILELTMPVSLSIKAVPDELVERLRRRAESNHRSLQRELMAIVEAAVQPFARQAVGMYAVPVRLGAVMTAGESEPVWQVVPPSSDDGLLDELDAIVSGSHWGEAPLLTREQLHDRALAREIDFDARQAERGVAQQRPGKGVS